MRTVPGIVTALLGLAAAAQTPGASPATPQASTGSTQTYTDPELHLTFIYPANLKPLDAKAVAALGHSQAFDNDPGANTGQLQSEGCSSVLLAVGSESAPNQSGQNGVWGGILLTAIAPACLPPKALRSKGTMDGLLTPMAKAGTQILGMMPMDKPVTYLIEEHKVHMAAAQGQPVAPTDLQPAEGTQYIAVLAVALEEHIVLWKIEANDLGLFNRLLSSRADFGPGSPQPLYPLRLQGETPPFQ